MCWLDILQWVTPTPPNFTPVISEIHNPIFHCCINFIHIGITMRNCLQPSRTVMMWTQSSTPKRDALMRIIRKVRLIWKEEVGHVWPCALLCCEYCACLLRSSLLQSSQFTVFSSTTGDNGLTCEYSVVVMWWVAPFTVKAVRCQEWQGEMRLQGWKEKSCTHQWESEHHVQFYLVVLQHSLHKGQFFLCVCLCESLRT